MFKLYARKNELVLRQEETLTSGSVNVNEVEFTFSADWDGLTRTAVFRAGDESREVALDGTGRCSMPWEVLAKVGREVEAGVYGSASGGEIVLPTIWASLGKVLEGTVPGEGARPPTPDLWEQKLANKQDKLKGEPGQIVGFDEAGNAVPQDNTGGSGGVGPPGPPGPEGEPGPPGYSPTVEVTPIEGGNKVTITDVGGPKEFDVLNGTGGSGTVDHNKLTNRDMADQHPIEAITGLQAALDTIPVADGYDANTYSTEEQRIGTWIDGKPIYRRVFLLSGLNKVIAETQDIEIILNVDAFCEIEPNTYAGITYSYMHCPNNATVFGKSADGVALLCNSSKYVFKSGYATITYTKTTD